MLRNQELLNIAEENIFYPLKFSRNNWLLVFSKIFVFLEQKQLSISALRRSIEAKIDYLLTTLQLKKYVVFIGQSVHLQNSWCIKREND
jgi:hypothetical protein